MFTWDAVLAAWARPSYDYSLHVSCQEEVVGLPTPTPHPSLIAFRCAAQRLKERKGGSCQTKRTGSVPGITWTTETLLTGREGRGRSGEGNTGLGFPSFPMHPVSALGVGNKRKEIPETRRWWELPLAEAALKVAPKPGLGMLRGRGWGLELDRKPLSQGCPPLPGLEASPTPHP